MEVFALKQPKDSNHTLDEIFEDYLKSPTLFQRRDVLDSSFVPENLPHGADSNKSLRWLRVGKKTGI